MSTPQDYDGRSVDVCAFQGVQEAGTNRLTAELVSGDTMGTVCTGIQKLAQRWTICFLTPRGSVPYRENEGSSFLIRLRTGRIRTEVDVRQVFSAAAREVAAMLRADESEDDPLDERFESAVLDSLTITPNLLQIKVLVLSLAGTSRPVILPLPLTFVGEYAR